MCYFFSLYLFVQFYCSLFILVWIWIFCFICKNGWKWNALVLMISFAIETIRSTMKNFNAWQTLFNFLLSRRNFAFSHLKKSEIKEEEEEQQKINDESATNNRSISISIWLSDRSTRKTNCHRFEIKANLVSFFLNHSHSEKVK